MRVRKGWGLPVRRIAILAAVPVVLYLGYVVASRALEFSALRSESSRLQAEIRTLQEQAQKLELRKQEVQQEQHIERIAREELGLVKKGETAIVVIPEASKTGPAAEAGQQAPGASLPNWRQWWEWLFGAPGP